MDQSEHAASNGHMAADGRFSAQDAVQPYEPPRLIDTKVRLLTTAELEAGYEAVGRDGAPERREFEVLVHLVVEPEVE